MVSAAALIRLKPSTVVRVVHILNLDTELIGAIFECLDTFRDRLSLAQEAISGALPLNCPGGRKSCSQPQGKPTLRAPLGPPPLGPFLAGTVRIISSAMVCSVGWRSLGPASRP